MEAIYEGRLLRLRRLRFGEPELPAHCVQLIEPFQGSHCGLLTYPGFNEDGEPWLNALTPSA